MDDQRMSLILLIFFFWGDAQAALFKISEASGTGLVDDNGPPCIMH